MKTKRTKREIKLKHLIMLILIGLFIIFSLYIVMSIQKIMFNDIDKACNNTNKTINSKYGNVDCLGWNTRNYTMI